MTHKEEIINLMEIIEDESVIEFIYIILFERIALSDEVFMSLPESQ